MPKAEVPCTVCKAEAVAVVRDGTRPVCEVHRKEAKAAGYRYFWLDSELHDGE